MTSAAKALSLVAALDDLFRSVLAEPSAWAEPELGGWLEDLAGQHPEGLDRVSVRHVRRAVRQAAKLARFWRDGRDRPDDWRSAVDEALGSPGWAPSLELARHALQTDPDPELYELVAERFRVVHFRPWMDGLGYDEWLAARADNRTTR